MLMYKQQHKNAEQIMGKQMQLVLHKVSRF